MKILSKENYRKIMLELTNLREKYSYIKDLYNGKLLEVDKLQEKNKRYESEIKMISNRESILKNKLSNLESELEDMNIKNFEAMELLGKTDSNWTIIGNRIIRINPLTKKPEKYDIPFDFDESNINKFEISDDLTWITFEYEENSNSYKMEKYEMPTTAGKKIGIKKIDELIGNNDINDINQIKSEEDLINYLKKTNININNKNWELAIVFLSIRRGHGFRFEEFEKNCKFGNRESARICINRLIEVGLIKRIRKGAYIVLFKY